MAERRLAIIQRGLQQRRHAPREGSSALGQQPPLRPSPAMHSSEVRDEDFEVLDHGTPLDLPHFLPHINRLTRVGVVAPESGTEAAGAASLILAMITAFYDDLRTTGPADFFAYPDFFVFQPADRPAPAPYSMFGAFLSTPVLACLAAATSRLPA